MRELTTEIAIDAPAETVWAVLTDFDRYDEWNPALAVEGRPEEGTRLTVSPGPEASDAPTFRPRVLTVDPPRELTWKGRLYVPGLFDGRHSFAVEDLGDGRSRLVQSERFSGLLVGPIMRRYGADTERNFDAMNEALKARAESVVADSASDHATTDGDRARAVN